MDAATQAQAEAEKLVGDDGTFHAHDEAVRLGGTPVEGWAALALFWALGLTVFYQFLTRYAFNDSAAWTEEIARYLLICVVFFGISASVRRTRHIHIDFLFRILPPLAGRVLSTLIDIVRLAFFVIATGLTIQMMSRMSHQQMTIIDLPMNIVYGVCAVGFAAAALRSVQVAIENWRRGYSVLERPDYGIEETIK